MNDEGLRRKILAVENALKVNQPDMKDGLDILSKVGGLRSVGWQALFSVRLRTQNPHRNFLSPYHQLGTVL